MPLNAYYSDEIEILTRNSVKRQEHRIVDDLNKLIEKWLNNNDTNDTYRILGIQI